MLFCSGLLFTGTAQQQSLNQSRNMSNSGSSSSSTLSVPVTLQIERRVVTHAQWARRGQANPENLILTSRLIQDIR